MENIVETPKQIAQHYKAAMDSANLINDLKAKALLTAEEVDRMKRNQEHLLIVLAKTCWTTEDMLPLKAASV